MNGHKGEIKFSCTKCFKAFKRKEHATRHERNCNGQHQSSTSSGSGSKRKRTTPITSKTAKTAFAKANITWKLVYDENEGVDYIDLIHNSVPAMKHHLDKYQEERRALKFTLSSRKRLIHP